jgi:molybdopterin molybdotransferase
MIVIERAYELLRTHVVSLKTQSVLLDQAVTRVLAASVFADIDSPPHRKSLMDGFAVRSEDINGGISRLRVVETIVAGGFPEKIIGVGQAARIMTGAPLPEGADAVVRIEDTHPPSDENETLVRVQLSQLAPKKFVVEQAAHFTAGQLLFNAGHQIRACDIGLLAEAGASTLEVFAQPTLAILPTGDELVDVSQRPQRGQIRNSNGPMLAAMARQLGLQPRLLPTVSDDQGELEQAISLGLEHDLLILTGGVSEGLLDLVPKTLQKLGVEEVFHKVRIKPGKPIWFGRLQRSAPREAPREKMLIRDTARSSDSSSPPSTSFTYVFGLPGNPVSSLVGFHLFVSSAIRLMEGRTDPQRHHSTAVDCPSHTLSKMVDQSPYRSHTVTAVLSKDHETRGDRPTFWPGKWVLDPSPTRIVEPLVWQGSSDLISLGQADGLIHFPCEPYLHAAGSHVDFLPFL